MATLQNLIDAVDNLEDSISDLSSQVNIRKTNLDSAIVSAQDSRNQAATSATQAGTSATQAATSAANAVAAAGQATQVAFGQGTGIAGIIPTARIRANSAFLSPQFNFTRSGSAGTVFNRQLRLADAPANSPRFDFDPLTGEALGILVESSKTNFLTRSNDFGNASWGKTNSTVIPNSGLSPEVQNNAWLLRESSDSVASAHFIGGNNVTINAGTEYTFSIFAKAATRSNLMIALPGAQTWAGSTSELRFSFDLIAGTLIRRQGSGGVGSMQNLGNGWYRCSVTITATASSTTDPRFVIESSIGTLTYIGDGVSGLLIYGAQAEVGGLSSYIPTTTNAVTRNADDPLDQRIETVNPSEGTIIIRARRNSGNPGTAFFIMNNGSSNNQISIVATGLFRTSINGVNYDISAGNSGIGVFDIYAVSYTQTRVAVSRNGGAVQSVAIPSFFTPTLLALRNFATDSSKHIHTYQYLPKALTDAQLIVRSNPATFFGFENGDVALNADLGDAAFVNVNAIQQLPNATPMTFFGNGTNMSYSFTLDFDCFIRDTFTSGSSFTRPTPGTVIPRGTNITVTHNAPAGTVLILTFVPIAQ